MVKYPVRKPFRFGCPRCGSTSIIRITLSDTDGSTSTTHTKLLCLKCGHKFDMQTKTK